MAGSGCQRSGGERLRCSCDRCRLWSVISHLVHTYDFSGSSFHCQSLWQCRTVKSGLFRTSSSGFLCVQGIVKGKEGTSVKGRQGRTRFDCQKWKKKVENEKFGFFSKLVVFWGEWRVPPCSVKRGGHSGVFKTQKEILLSKMGTQAPQSKLNGLIKVK